MQMGPLLSSAQSSVPLRVTLQADVTSYAWDLLNGSDGLGPVWRSQKSDNASDSDWRDARGDYVLEAAKMLLALSRRFDKAELTKAVRVAGLPEGRKPDMVKSLVGAFQHSPKQVEVVVLGKPKRRKRILPNA